MEMLCWQRDVAGVHAEWIREREAAARNCRIAKLFSGGFFRVLKQAKEIKETRASLSHCIAASCAYMLTKYSPRFKHVQTYRTWLINGTTAHSHIRPTSFLHTSFVCSFGSPTNPILGQRGSHTMSRIAGRMQTRREVEDVDCTALRT